MCAANAVDVSRPRASRPWSAYVAVARATFRRYSTYRMATFAYALETSVASMIQAFVLIAAVRTIGDSADLTRDEAATFAFLSGITQLALWVTVPLDIDGRIRTGDVIVDLQRPVDFQAWWCASEAGRAVHALLTRGLLPYVFGVVVLDIAVPESVGTFALYLLSLALGFTVAYAWRFIVSLSGFWMLDTRGAASLAGVIVTFASGALLPLSLLPDGLADVMRVLPFASIVQTPFEVFTGERAVAPALAGQLVWAIVLLAVGRLVLRRAVAKVVIQGG